MTTSAKSNQKIDEALALLNEAARDKKEEIGSLLDEKYADIKDVLKGVETNVEEHAADGMAAAKELKQRADEAVKDTAAHVDETVHQDPWKVLGWGVAGAFLLGYLVGNKE